MALGGHRKPVPPAIPRRTVSGAERAQWLYGPLKPVVTPVYGAGKATDFVNRSKKVYP